MNTKTKKIQISKEDLKKLIEQKRFMISCFLYTLSIKNEENKDTVLKHGVTKHFLFAIILELFIKIFYELDKKEEAPYHHKVLEIFSSLDEPSKIFIKDKFAESEDRGRNIREKIFKKFGEEITQHSLEDVLKSNPDTVMNFKYNAIATGTNSPIDGLFYTKILEGIDDAIKAL